MHNAKCFFNETSQNASTDGGHRIEMAERNYTSNVEAAIGLNMWFGCTLMHFG